MPWLLRSPGHQQPCYWLCRIGRFLSCLRKDLNYLRAYIGNTNSISHKICMKLQHLVDSCDSLHWRYNGHDSVSNHQPHDCLLNRLFRRRSKKISKLRVIGLCAGNSPETGEFPAQMASNAENVSIWWRHDRVSYVWCITQILHRRYGYKWNVRPLIRELLLLWLQILYHEHTHCIA